MHRTHLDFALAVHGELPTDDSGGGSLWSPYSVASALGLAAEGARGSTRDELVGMLAPGGELPTLARDLAEAARIDDAESAVVNSLWMGAGTDVRAEYQDTVRRWPGGELHTADFSGDPDGSRQKINSEVEQTTRGLIRELLAAGSITPETAAVIVNALYLKVAWQQPFGRDETVRRAFHAPSGTHDVATMRQTERVTYAERGGWRLVSLPTASRGVVMDVALASDDAAGMPSAETLRGLWAAARPTRVSLAVPRFRVEAGFELNAPLSALGVRAPFQRGAADFSGITDAEMFVETAVHKAVLTVDEDGFEGAAATALAFRLTSIDLSRPVVFDVDRPFVVLVRHERTGAVYFLGRVTEPDKLAG